MATKKVEKKEDSTKKTCFVIMPFSDPEGYEPGHFRNVYEYTFVPAIRVAGYEPLRIDDNIVSSLIHGKMMNELITAPMVLCDLSTNNPNVLYELGIRHAFDLPVVLVQEIGQKRIFDIAGITSVEYHRSRLYEDVLEDQKKIAEALRQTANAKTKYSIMNLVAIQAAKPTDGASVTREDRLEYLIRDLSKKMNGLEKRFVDTQRSGAEFGQNVGRNYGRENSLASLKSIMEEIDDYLLMVDIEPDLASLEETNSLGNALYRQRNMCLDAGVSSALLDRADELLTELNKLYRKLEEKET